MDTLAPFGKIWQCQACGKTARDLYGEEGGWDESCMLNAVLVDRPIEDVIKPIVESMYPLKPKPSGFVS